MQSQWLFEAPFTPSTAHYSGSYSNPEMENEWEIYETSSPKKTASKTRHSAKPAAGSADWFRKFKEPFHDQTAKMQQGQILQKLQECQRLGQRYQELVAKDMGAADVQEKFRRAGRRMDIGTNHEVTLEGRDRRFSLTKMKQLESDLQDTGQILLTVPKLSPQAEIQLKQLGAEFEKQRKRVLIIVRETLD